MEITKAVREAIGKDCLLLVRLGLDGLLPGGLTLDEGCLAAKKLEKLGIDILDVFKGLVPPPDATRTCYAERYAQNC